MYFNFKVLLPQMAVTKLETPVENVRPWRMSTPRMSEDLKMKVVFTGTSLKVEPLEQVE